MSHFGFGFFLGLVWRHMGLESYLIFTLCTAHQLFMMLLLLLLQGNGAEKVQLATDSGQQLKPFAVLVLSICKQRCHLSNFDIDAGKATTKKENKNQKLKTENQNKISWRLPGLLMTNFPSICGGKFNWVSGKDFKAKTGKQVLSTPRQTAH